MSTTWKHPSLGTFEYDDDRSCWVGTCDLPAFKVFKWKADSSDPREIIFDSPDGDEPSPGAAKVASLVVANHAKLASLITPTLWEGFNGRGPVSGMWWHNDLKEVSKNFGYSDLPAPKKADDLLLVMRFTGLTIYEEVYDYEKPIAELTFAALFEEEHGIGFLADGNKILGTGYSGDTSPFEQ